MIKLEDPRSDNSCTFCTSREPVKVVITSSHPSRRLVVAVCPDCFARLLTLLECWV